MELMKRGEDNAAQVQANITTNQFGEDYLIQLNRTEQIRYESVFTVIINSIIDKLITLLYFVRNQQDFYDAIKVSNDLFKKAKEKYGTNVRYLIEACKYVPYYFIILF